MGKLHELLAVEPDLKNQAESILAETLKIFEKGELFQGFTKRYHPVDENGDRKPQENKELAATVTEKLAGAEKALARYLDGIYQKELANTEAFADIVVDGFTLAKRVPATVLLQLENRLKHVRDMYRKIPNLEPGVRWIPDETQRQGVYSTEESITNSTQKIQKALVLYPHTDKHPAQVQIVSEDILVGKWHTVHFSGKMSSAKKAELLERIDNLIEAIKKARCSANNVEAQNVRIGDKLFLYIQGKYVASE